MTDADRPEPRRRPTINDVAERASVSKSLVSLVLRGSTKVSAKSRLAIQQAIDELGYRPSSVARSLVTGRTDTVGVVVSEPLDEAHTILMQGIQVSTAASGSRPLIMYGRSDAGYERQLVDAFLDLRVDGLIFLGSALPDDELAAIGEKLPVAVVGRRMRPGAVDVVTADSHTGARLATQHLIDLGHERIAHIDVTLVTDDPQCRAGYLATMEEHGFAPVVEAGSRDQEEGEAAARRLLGLDEVPTAIFAAGDLSALGAREVILTEGITIPGGISLVGYHDTPFARLRGIDLTSVREPSEAMGIYASEAVAYRLMEPSEPPGDWIAEPELVVRSSTGPPER